MAKHPNAEPAQQQDVSSRTAAIETVESIVIALILAFVFRAYVVEAFVIPTGSMAPTLLGEHHPIDCEQCGYHFAIDHASERFAGDRTPPDKTAVCPMCHFPNRVSGATVPRAGDRILVHKYLYSLSEPQRWDVVVFKNPTQPDINYIKRLVGLPNEQLSIIDGNIYARPIGPDAQPVGDWQIARKADRPEVQRAVWQPVYDSRYVPLDGGQNNAQRLLGEYRYEWSNPWVPDAPALWDMENDGYRYVGDGNGQLRFDFDRADAPLLQWMPYNQLKSAARQMPPPLIEDVRIALAVQPEQQPVGLEMRTTARLAEPLETASPLVARYAADGAVTLSAMHPQTGQRRELAVGAGPALEPGVTREIEFWWVDQQASVWVDGERVLRWNLDLPFDAVLERGPIPPTPRVSVEVSGGPAQLFRVSLDRDIFYTSTSAGGGRTARGFMMLTGRGLVGQPVTLDAGQFFCLGDNSALSHDSRFWDDVDYWVRRELLADEPQPFGVVPRQLMMGRAFFVYFPGTIPLDERQTWGVPNFGDLRFIH